MATVIRPATMDDVDAIVEMGRRFYPESGYEATAPFCEEQIAGLAIVTMRDGVMLVAEKDGEVVGMACLHVEPFLFNPSVVIAHELVYWIEPEHRGGMMAARMLKAIEEACRAKGATTIRMATLSSSPEAADKLYMRAGFHLSEKYYSKGLH